MQLLTVLHVSILLVSLPYLSSNASPSYVDGFLREKLPGVSIPAALLPKISPLGLLEMQRLDQQMGGHDLQTRELCAAANLLCDTPVNYVPAAGSGYACPSCLQQYTETLKRMFFSPEHLRVGGHVALQALEDLTSGYAMLPRALASKMPFSSNTLPQLKEAFNILPGSNMSRMMDITMKWCETPHPDDVGNCSASLEDMVDMVLSELGPNVEILSQPDRPGPETLQVMKLEPSKSSMITCHSFPFPFGVYYCHRLGHTSTYKVTVKSSIDDQVSLRPALCHSMLHINGVSTTLCHFLFGSHFSWVAKG